MGKVVREEGECSAGKIECGGNGEEWWGDEIKGKKSDGEDGRFEIMRRKCAVYGMKGKVHSSE